MNPQRDDEALMTRARTGDRVAFEALTRRYYAAVVRFCQRSASQGAEDLAQETFVRVWNARARYETRQGFRVYLYTIAQNVCRSAARGEGRRHLQLVEPEALAERPDQQPLASSQLEVLQSHQSVQHALTQLPEAQREVLVLRLSEGLDYAEISQILGRSESTLRSQAFYGLKTLKKMVAT